MRILRMGDPHIRPSNIEEADRLMAFAKEIIVGGKIDRFEILGDLFHTHAVIRLEVLEFWNKWLQVFSGVVETVVLVGNHDMTGDHNSQNHALKVFKRINNERLKIIDRPAIIGPFVYCPYIHSNGTFIQAVRGFSGQGAKVLVCHQTFAGSQFDNGFYAPEGINPDDIPFEKIISGHIHKEQIIAGGKVDYPGTPKWDSASDANERKGLWLYEHDPVTGAVLSRNLIPTDITLPVGIVCTPIVSVVWKEGEEKPKLSENAKNNIELIGSSEWIGKQKPALKGLASIKVKVTDKKRVAERKTGNNLEFYLKNMYVSTVNKEILLKRAQELGIV